MASFLLKFIGMVLLLCQMTSCQSGFVDKKSTENRSGMTNELEKTSEFSDTTSGRVDNFIEKLGLNSTENNGASSASNTSVEYGTGLFVEQREKSGGLSASLQGGQTQSFQFRDAALDVVLAQILGEGFGVSYVIAPGVSGQITLRLEGISSVDEAVDALNVAIEPQGYLISKSGQSYLLSRSGRGQVKVSGEFEIISSESQHSTSDSAVLVLQYANPEEVVKLAEPLLPKGIVKNTNASRGIVLLQGNVRDVSQSVDTLRSFDVDWFAATSSAYIELKEAEANEIKTELDLILGRTGGVEIVALPRLRALLIFARSSALLDRSRVLVSQLDRSIGALVDSGTLVYEAQYIDAEHLASIAQDLMGGGLSLSRSTSGESGHTSGGEQGSFNARNSNIGNSRASNTVQSRVSLTVDKFQNLVIALGSPTELDRIKRLLQRIDNPQPQVLVEVTIAEIVLRDEFSLGVQWHGIEEKLSATFSDAVGGSVTSSFPGLSISYANTDISSVLNVLDSETDVQVVSSPRILALNNHSARIQVGDQVPVIVQSAVGISDGNSPIINTTEYRDTGIILEVTPRVRGRNSIEIEIAQEVSDVAATSTAGISSPTISQRQLNSVLSIPNGATVAMGGLISTNETESEVGVPVLRKMPLVGGLFSSIDKNTRKTELVVLIRPQIVQPTVNSYIISDRLRQALHDLQNRTSAY